MKPPVLDDYRSLAMARQVQIAGNPKSDLSPDRDSASGCPKVSLVTVVLNGEKTLRCTIKSVLAQSYGNIEYIVVDGGSTDSTIDIIREYGEKITCWISEPDRGISDAFNKGVALATGDIVGFINADDWLEPWTVEAVVSHLGSTREPAIVHGMIQYWSVRGREDIVVGDHALIEKDMTVNHPTVFATAECYRRFGLFRLDFYCAMDYEWLLRAHADEVHFIYLPKALVNMQLGGVSDRNWRLAIREVARAKAMHMGNGLGSYAYSLIQVAKGSVRHLLDDLGLDFVTHFFHSHFSLVKKTKSSQSHGQT